MGHDLHSKEGQADIYKDTPWGVHLDGGLLKALPDFTYGYWIEAHVDDWTAVAFWDRSGDSRPGSNSAFIVHDNVDGNQLFKMAREQWPEVFSRSGFPQLQNQFFY